jgi:predicted Fe-Mo cluster-binding NifX family protein
MIILIALDENKGINSKLSKHFGHCPFFALYETKNKNLKIINNNIDHSVQNLTPVDQVMKHNPNIVFSKGIGQKAINLFKEKGIEIKTGNFSNLKELIENIKNLQNIKNGNLK